MKIGIYGGTFDPPHLAHMAAARVAMEQLELDLESGDEVLLLTQDDQVFYIIMKVAEAV